MNEKETIKLANKLEKMIKLNQLEEIQKLNHSIKILDRENYSDIFIDACDSGNFEIVKYLFELRNPGEYALHDGFRCCLDVGNLNTIKVLICDLKIQKNSDVNEELKRHLDNLKEWNEDFYNEVITLFNPTNKLKSPKK